MQDGNEDAALRRRGLIQAGRYERISEGLRSTHGRTKKGSMMRMGRRMREGGLG